MLQWGVESGEDGRVERRDVSFSSSKADPSTSKNVLKRMHMSGL